MRQSKELCRRASALSGRRECGRARQRLRTGPLTEAGGPGGGRARWRARWARPRWCGRCASAPSTSAAGWARGWAARRRSTGARSGTAWSRRRAIFHCAQPPLRLSHLCSTSSRVACTALTVMYLYVSNLLYICMVKSEPAMALTVLRRRAWPWAWPRRSPRASRTGARSLSRSWHAPPRRPAPRPRPLAAMPDTLGRAPVAQAAPQPCMGAPSADTACLNLERRGSSEWEGPDAERGRARARAARLSAAAAARADDRDPAQPGDRAAAVPCGDRGGGRGARAAAAGPCGRRGGGAPAHALAAKVRVQVRPFTVSPSAPRRWHPQAPPMHCHCFASRMGSRSGAA